MPEGKKIFFFNELPIQFQLRHKTKLRKWLIEIAKQEQHQINQLNYIFCNDEYLFEMNKKYLNHHTYTDILTFDSSEIEKQIEGDIYISIDRVKENARIFTYAFAHELYRVIVHGLLHLCGYDDKSDGLKKTMRKKEDACVKQLLSML